MKFVLRNWCVLLLSKEKEWIYNGALKNKLKKIFELKASGREEDYISILQQTKDLRELLEEILIENIIT